MLGNAGTCRLHPVAAKSTPDATDKKDQKDQKTKNFKHKLNYIHTNIYI